MDKFYVGYFLVHVVITLLIDATIALPREWLFPVQKYLADVHMANNKDLLVAARPVWLQAYVWVELALQTPFFVWAAHDLSRGLTRVYPAVLVYGVEASTTTFACLAEVAFVSGLTPAERFKLFAVYLPTLVIPLYMTFDFYGRISRGLRLSAVSKQKVA